MYGLLHPPVYKRKSYYVHVKVDKRKAGLRDNITDLVKVEPVYKDGKTTIPSNWFLRTPMVGMADKIRL